MGDFLPRLLPQQKQEALKDPSGAKLYELLTEPLLEELYRQGDFDFLNRINPGQAVFLSYEYVRQQVLAGGFIQCIQNGYVPLIALLAEQLPSLGLSGLADLLDGVLIWYVENREVLEKDGGIPYFAALYDRFPQTQEWDRRFSEGDAETIRQLADFAAARMDQFALEEIRGRE